MSSRSWRPPSRGRAGGRGGWSWSRGRRAPVRARWWPPPSSARTSAGWRPYALAAPSSSRSPLYEGHRLHARQPAEQVLDLRPELLRRESRHARHPPDLVAWLRWAELGRRLHGLPGRRPELHLDRGGWPGRGLLEPGHRPGEAARGHRRRGVALPDRPAPRDPRRLFLRRRPLLPVGLLPLEDVRRSACGEHVSLLGHGLV